MSYINPIALFGKTNLTLPLREYDLDVIRTRILAEAKKRSVQNSEIETLLLKIQIPSYQELFYKLWFDKPLHDFLESGNLRFLSKENSTHSMSSQAYFKFWKPFFLWRYNEELSRAYLEKDIYQITKLQELPFDLTVEDQTIAFKDLKAGINKDLKLLSQFEIEARESDLSGKALLEQVNSVVNLPLINALPKELTPIRAVFAYRVLELSMVIYNQQQDFSTATSLLRKIHELDLHPDDTENLNIFSDQLADYVGTANLLEKYNSEIRAHLKKLRDLQTLIEKMDGNGISYEQVNNALQSGISPHEIGKLHPRFHFFADEYAKALRTFSAHVWNNTGNAKEAMHLLTISEQLPLSEQQAEELQKDKAQLAQRIEKEQQHDVVNDRRTTINSKSGALYSTSDIWPAVFISTIVLAFILALIGGWDRINDVRWPSIVGTRSERAIANNDRGQAGSSGKKKKTTPATEKPLTSVSSTVTIDSSNVSSEGFLIVENRLETGDSPYDPFYGKGRFNDIAQSQILVRNLSGLDVVVCLEERGSGKTIRNEYIRADDQYRLSNIPEGYYMVKTFYGRNWDQNRNIRDRNINLEGSFIENFFFKKPDGGKRYWEVYDLNLSYTSYEITLEPLDTTITMNFQPVEEGLLSWNLRDFGRTKNDKELEVISRIVRNFDIVAIQEVVAGPGGAQAVALLADQLNRTGSKWDYRISDPTDSPLYKTERYAFLWKTAKAEIIGYPWLEKALSEEIYREPYLARFSMKGDTILIANYHSRNSREDPVEELRYLFQLPDDYPNDKVIIAGDFNLEINDLVFQDIYMKGYMSSPNFLKTTLKTQCDEGEYLSRAIDHIFYPSDTAFLSGSIDFIGNCSHLEFGRQISDHLPVWVQLYSDNTLEEF